MLDAHSGWDAARLDLLRLLVQSADRALALTDDDERRRETRTLIGIYKTLNLRTDDRTDSDGMKTSEGCTSKRRPPMSAHCSD